MGHPGSLDADALLADVQWVRGLARGLVRDAVLAEDAAQEAWLAALAKPATRPAKLRAWLAGATRNAALKAYRSEGRRRARERAAARPERTPSTADVVEELSTQLTVARAVHELPEPYRETILLRYYEELSLAEVGERTGAPVPTVGARVKRGLELLRGTLQKRLGADGRDWMGALLPLLARDASIRTGTQTIGLALARLAPVASVAVALVAGGLALRAAWTPERAPVVPVADAPASAAATIVPAGRGETQVERSGRVARADRSTRTPAAAAHALPPGAGDLTLRVRTADGEPAPALLVSLDGPDGGGPGTSRRRTLHRTDPVGELLLDDLAAGEWTIAPVLGGAARFRVPTDSSVPLTLRLPPGPPLSGIVVDAAGRPVPGAGIWLSTHGAQEVAGTHLRPSEIDDECLVHTGPDGTFHLPTVGAARTLGARAEGLAPSTVYAVPRLAAAELRMRLVLPGAGGALRGRVTGPDGVPQGSASVRIDVGSREEQLPDGRRATSPYPLVRARSDADGHFRVSGVRPGARRVLVRAPGLAPWRGEVHVEAGAEARVDVRLERGASVAGTVTGPGGAPLADVLVRASRRPWQAARPAEPGNDPPDAPSVRTAEDGRFVLEGLAPGHCWIAVDGGERGRADELLRLASGRALRHDVTLTPGPQLRGRVVDSHGAPIPGVRVLARQAGEWRSVSTLTDADGAFAFESLEDEPCVLRVGEGPFAVLHDRHARPGPGETVLRVDDASRPTARVIGVVTDADGRDRAPAAVRLLDVESARSFELAVEPTGGGAFHSAPFPAGVWRIALVVDGHPLLLIDGEHAVATGQEVDLGHVAVGPAGTLLLQVAPPDARGLLDLRVSVTDSAGLAVHDLRLPDAAGHLPLTLPVQPGRHTVRAWAAGLAPRVASLDVRADTVAPLALELQAGSACALTCRAATGTREPRLVRFQVRDATGGLLLEETALRIPNAPDAPFAVTVDLLPGTYDVLAQGEGLAARGSLTVEHALRTVPLDLVLEPRSAR